jgi:hypothetical protein
MIPFALLMLGQPTAFRLLRHLTWQRLHQLDAARRRASLGDARGVMKLLLQAPRHRSSPSRGLTRLRLLQ